MKKLGLNSGYIGSDQRFSTNGIVGYDKLLLERKNGRFLPSISGIFLLDVFPATAAFSLRRLRSDYTGAAITVRRASNNDELNIGFNGEILDISTLNSFCSGTNGFVTTWYDQQGSNNATQSTAGAQPKIYDSSTGVVLENGKPALDFDGTDDVLTGGNFINGTTNRSVMVVYKPNIIATNTIMFDLSSATSGTGVNYAISPEIALRTRAVTYVTTVGTLNESLISIYQSNNIIQSGIQMYYNSNFAPRESGGDGTINTEASNFNIGSLASLSFFSGKIKEIITYNTNQSSNRTLIETNINNYYNIY